MQSKEVVQTTLRLPDGLRHQAKIQAAVLRVSLNDFIVNAVREAVPGSSKK